jgi:hypothetical protein
MPCDEVAAVFLLNILILDFDVDHFIPIHFLQFDNLLPQTDVLQFHGFQLLIVTHTEILVFGKLVLKFVVLVVVGALEFADFVFEEEDLGSVVLLKSVDLHALLSRVLLLRVLEFPLHVVVGPCNQILELVLLLLKLDFISFFQVDQVVAPDRQHVELLDLVFQHEF